jgi:hypothetical protein
MRTVAVKIRSALFCAAVATFGTCAYASPVIVCPPLHVVAAASPVIVCPPLHMAASPVIVCPPLHAHVNASA